MKSKLRTVQNNKNVRQIAPCALYRHSDVVLVLQGAGPYWTLAVLKFHVEVLLSDLEMPAPDGIIFIFLDTCT